jgi:hypothetical protein
LTKTKTNEKVDVQPDSDQVWIPFTEMKKYLSHLTGMLNGIVKGIELSIKQLEESKENSKNGDDDDDNNED